VAGIYTYQLWFSIIVVMINSTALIADNIPRQERGKEMIVSYKGEEIEFAVEIKKSACREEDLPPEVIAILKEGYKRFFQSLMYAGLAAVYSGRLMESFEKDFHLLVEKYKHLLEEQVRKE